MKKFLDSNLMLVFVGIYFIIMWFIGKNSSTSELNSILLSGLGGMFCFIGITSILLEKYLKKKPLKKVGYVNKNDEYNVMIREKARNAVYHVMLTAAYILFGLTFSGIVSMERLGSNLPLYLIIFIPLLDLIFTGYYATKSQ